MQLELLSLFNNDWNVHELGITVSFVRKEFLLAAKRIVNAKKIDSTNPFIEKSITILESAKKEITDEKILKEIDVEVEKLNKTLFQM